MKGTLRTVNVNTGRVSVAYSGSTALAVANIPVPNNIPSNDLVIGRKVDVQRFSPSNPTDGVVTAVWSEDAGQSLKIIRKTADETVNNSTTLQDDDKIFLPVLANEVWEFRLVFRFNSSAVADFKMGWSVPTGTTMAWGLMESGGISVLTQASTTYIGANGSNVVDLAYGLIIVSSTAGNVVWRWAQNALEVSDTTVLANTTMIAQRVS